MTIFPFDLELDSGFKKEIKDFAQLQQFIQEVVAINAVPRIDSDNNALARLRSTIAQELERRNTLLRSLLTEENLERRATFAQRDAETLFQSHQLIAPGTLLSDQIKSCISDNPQVGLIVLGTVLNVTISDSILRELIQSAGSAYVRGISKAELILTGYPSSRHLLEAEVMSMKERIRFFLEDLDNARSRTKNAFARADDEVDGLLSSIRVKANGAELIVEKVNSLASQLDGLIKQNKGEIETILGSAKSRVQNELSALKEQSSAVLQSIRLSSSTAVANDYWANKQSQHREKAKKLLFLVGGTALLSAVGILLILQYVATGEAPLLQTPFRQALIAVLPTLGALWLLKVLIRQWLTQVSLGEDAEERVAMIRTFLALTTDTNISVEERSIFLRSLFRPFGTLQPDEGAPDSLIMHLVNSTKNEK